MKANAKIALHSQRVAFMKIIASSELYLVLCVPTPARIPLDMELTEFSRKHAQKHILSTLLLREVELAFKKAIPEIQCAQACFLAEPMTNFDRLSMFSETSWVPMNLMHDIKAQSPNSALLLSISRSC